MDTPWNSSDRRLRAAITTVRCGLEIARAGVGAEEIASKRGRDLVTATDMAVEDELRRVVEEATPRSVVGEERGEAPADGSAYWLLDPICGTRNFASGIPLYCINLALVEGDEITRGRAGRVDRRDPVRGAWSPSVGDRPEGSAWAGHRW